MKNCFLIFVILITALDKAAISQDSTGFADYQMILEFHPDKNHIDSLIKLQSDINDILYKELDKEVSECFAKQRLYWVNGPCNLLADSLAKFSKTLNKKIAAYKDSLYSSLDLKIMTEINLFAKANNSKYIINSADKRILYVNPDFDLTNKIIDWINKKYNKK